MYSSLNGIRQHFKSELSQRYSDREIDQLFYRLLESFGGITKTDAILTMKDLVDEDLSKDMVDAAMRLRAGEPVQYIDNTVWFMEEVFYVDDQVLIPRPETEELVRLILDQHGEEETTILDIGTGSGIIPISLAKHRPKWKVFHNILSPSFEVPTKCF